MQEVKRPLVPVLGAEGMAILFGLESVGQLAERLDPYRAIRAAAGVSDDAVDRKIGKMHVLRRIGVADTDAAALREVQEPRRWHCEMGMRVHERGEAIDTRAFYRLRWPE